MREATTILSAEGVSLCFGCVKFLTGVSIGVQAGEIFSIIGLNGAPALALGAFSRIWRC